MAFMFYDINFLVVLFVSIIGFVIGMLWYSPMLFGNAWIKLMKFSKNDMKKAKEKGMTRSMFLAFVAVYIMANILQTILTLTQSNTLFNGALWGFLVWFGFVGTTMLNSVLWEGKSWNLYLINISHYLVVLIVMGAILGVWN